MLPFRSIPSLYPLALAEGEGVGTAYEYLAKRLKLAPWLATLPEPKPRKMLIAGLPEKYGSSLDFFLIAQEIGVTDVAVVEERPDALEKCRKSVAAAQALGHLEGLQPRYQLVRDLSQMTEVEEIFDLGISSEVLQRLGSVRGESYIARLAELAPAIALFAPNGDNPSHTNISNLSGVSLSQIRAFTGEVRELATSGYVDMPPFPPGVTRSAAQRKQASSGRFEAFAMWGLAQYARCEAYFPSGWRRQHAHIVYAFTRPSSKGLMHAAACSTR